MLMDDISHDEVRTAQDIETFRGDVADDADGKARSREWLTIDDFFRKTQLTAELADFVFEEFTKWFDEGEFHILRETAYIMMGLDGRSGRGAGFYNVRIEGARYEEFHIFELVRFFLEGMDEFCTDGLTFLFRFGDAFQKGHEVLGCIDVYQLHVEFVRKGIDDLFCFAETQEAVVDENAGQLIADGFVYEDSCDRGVDAAGEGADDIVISDFFTDIFDSEILPYNKSAKEILAEQPKGIIFSGGPSSVNAENAPEIDPDVFKAGVPILGICYGMQLMAKTLGGEVSKPEKHEYGHRPPVTLLQRAGAVRGK